MKRRRATPDRRLADAVVALRLHALLPAATKKAVTRLRHDGADRERVLGQAVAALVPAEAVPLLLRADEIAAGGDWLGVFMTADSRLRMLDKLIEDGGLGDDAVGVALVWRLAFFELAVRIAAASFARAPDETPRLRHDLWAAKNGVGLFLRQLLEERGIKRKQLVDAWVTHAGAGENVEKSQLERWLYGGSVPQARHIEPLARAITIAARDDAPASIPALRVRLHLFLGCRVALATVTKVIGQKRATMLAATFAKQVHAAVATFQRSARNPPDGPNGPIPLEKWIAERRLVARKAAVFGISAGGLGSALLFETRDPDLAALVWPPGSPFLTRPTGVWADALERANPGALAAHEGVMRMVRSLTLDDVVADASERSSGRQPLGWLGLLEGVLGSRLSV